MLLYVSQIYVQKFLKIKIVYCGETFCPIEENVAENDAKNGAAFDKAFAFIFFIRVVFYTIYWVNNKVISLFFMIFKTNLLIHKTNINQLCIDHFVL